MNYLYRLIPFITVILGGCAANYTIKDGEPKAFVRFTTNVPTYFGHISQPLCAGISTRLAGFSSLRGKQLSNVRMLGSTGIPDDSVYEVLVAAGQPSYIYARSETPALAYSHGHICSLGVRVVFQPEHHYEVGYELSQSICRIRVLELFKSDNGMERRSEPSAQFISAKFETDFCGR